MNDLAPAADITVPADVLASILQVYDDGLYLQAYQRAQAVGPLPKWRGSEARILAGRLAGNLGSIRFADWHFVHAWRKDRTHPETLWYFARYLLSVRGPLAAWKFVQDHPFPRDAARTMQSHWFSQHATILGRLRDFDAAEVWLHKADALGEEAWTCLEWAALYTLEDRHADAEKAARRALQLHPWYRPAVQWVAHFLVQQQRDDEALQLLTQATGFLESGAVFAQLANLQMELKRYDDAGHSLDEVERLSPLADRHMKQWLDARRCDLACFRGDFDKAIEHGRKAVGTDARTKSKFYESLVPLLTNRTGPGKRVEVPVAFVQQHHRTCAPATLVAIAKFWTMPADHLEVAAEISYAGTPHHSQRKWAHDHGWLTKEFTVDWDTAVALIERGIPFTLTTTEVTTAHLQAVVGYDSLRRTLIIRDPGERHRVEMAYDVMLERYRSTGPRGMAMVPIAQKEKLAALTLPDEALYEILFQVERALKDHRREEARLGVEALAGQAPKHFLTATAQRILAIYDADMPAELTHTERLLELFPGDTHLELARAY
ncbi:MAG: C39 family peptidase, partial [Planctomycetes bacterium]|nr:C39 family peptidase [Planctomycetota bacterium]